MLLLAIAFATTITITFAAVHSNLHKDKMLYALAYENVQLENLITEMEHDAIAAEHYHEEEQAMTLASLRDAQHRIGELEELSSFKFFEDDNVELNFPTNHPDDDGFRALD